MRVTLQKIAEVANVSRGTVDKVLNNRPGVSDPVRERVKQVAAALDYKPNLIGKALARQNVPKTIGIIIAPDYNPFVKDIKRGVETAGREISDYGFVLDIRILNTLEIQEQINILNSFVENKVNGISMFSVDSQEIMSKVDEIVSSGIPVVTYNSDIVNSKRMCYVGQDHFKGGIVASDLMSKLLGDNGEKNILIITSLVELECHKERIAGFKQGIKEFGPNLNIVEIVENQDKEQLAYDYTMKKLKQYKNINGIYVTGGGANGVGEALKVLKAEKDIKIICHDFVETTTSLIKEGVIDFTIGQDPYYQGYQPVKVLFDFIIAGKKPKHSFIQTRVDIRSRSNI